MKRKLLSNLILAVAAVVLILLLNVISYFAAFAITVMVGGVNVLDSDTASVNQGIFNVIRYIFVIIVLGYIYYRSFYRGSSEEITERKESVALSLRFIIRPLTIFIILLAGLSVQLSTDSVLYVLGESFPTTFASYQHMMETFTGSRSVLFILTTITLGPIAEEIVFRGLALRFSLRAFEGMKKAPLIACLVQALLFGIYHGNLIQGTYALIFGFVLGMIAVKMDSILPSIFLHMAINGTLYLLPDKLFLSIPFAVLLGMIALAFLIASLLLLSLTYNNYKEHYSE